MPVSLCGKSPCPGICERVCHCPAGLARSHWLAGLYRNRRLVLKRGSSPSLIESEARPHQREHYPISKAKQEAVPYTRNLKPYTSAAVLAGLLLFMGIVVLIGITLNDGDFAPGYEPPRTYYQEWK